MADIGSVWAAGSWSTAAWAANTWADASTEVVLGGMVYITLNGVFTPPGAYEQGTQQHWMWMNGTPYVPVTGDRAASFPRSSDER